MANTKISITIAHATGHEQIIEEAQVEAGCSVMEAIELSNFQQKYPAVEVSINNVGIFGRRVSQAYILKEGDRVEIYRPLKHDPKVLRRMRIKKNQQAPNLLQGEKVDRF